MAKGLCPPFGPLQEFFIFLSCFGLFLTSGVSKSSNFFFMLFQSFLFGLWVILPFNVNLSIKIIDICCHNFSWLYFLPNLDYLFESLIYDKSYSVYSTKKNCFNKHQPEVCGLCLYKFCIWLFHFGGGSGRNKGNKKFEAAGIGDHNFWTTWSSTSNWIQKYMNQIRIIRHPWSI